MAELRPEGPQELAEALAIAGLHVRGRQLHELEAIALAGTTRMPLLPPMEPGGAPRITQEDQERAATQALACDLFQQLDGRTVAKRRQREVGEPDPEGLSRTTAAVVGRARTARSRRPSPVSRSSGIPMLWTSRRGPAGAAPTTDGDLREPRRDPVPCWGTARVPRQLGCRGDRHEPRRGRSRARRRDRGDRWGAAARRGHRAPSRAARVAVRRVDAQQYPLVAEFAERLAEDRAEQEFTDGLHNLLRRLASHPGANPHG